MYRIGFQSRFERKRYHSAKTAHLLFGDIVVRMIGQSREVYFFDFRMAAQKLGYFHTVFTMSLHSQMQGFDASQNQKAIHRSEGRTRSELLKMQLLTQSGVFYD